MPVKRETLNQANISNACDDGGFEEVSLDNTEEAAEQLKDDGSTAADDSNMFEDFNKKFPMKLSSSHSISSSCTEPSWNNGRTSSRGILSVASRTSWFLSSTEGFDNEDDFEDRNSVGSKEGDAHLFRERGKFRRYPSLVDELLSEIYARFPSSSHSQFSSSSTYTYTPSRLASPSGSPDSDCMTEYSTTSDNNYHNRMGIRSRKMGVFISKDGMPSHNQHANAFRRDSQKRKLQERGISELKHEVRKLETQVHYCMSQLTRQVKRRDRLRHRKERQNNLITAILQASSLKRSQDTRIRFSLEPYAGDPGYNQWKDAMKMVARLPEGVPEEFRKKLWLTLAERHLTRRGVDWQKSERFCFNEWSNPDDDELGLQIVRDLHRTGCSLFCGDDAAENQLMLKRVLLAYARWNKSIGYCQGFNMLAAIILEVMEKEESDSLKVMIFMIEGILPECYFTNNLRGLSVDMAVFRELLKLRFPELSNHLEELQSEAEDGGLGASYEPPLTNVFTMQWFLTLFSTCLPKDTVLRVWDLILLEGNEVLLRTALAIWKGLEKRIMIVSTADEFYCAMGQLSREMMEYDKDQSNKLIKDLVDLAPFPFQEVKDLREKFTYNITPWSQGIAVAKRGLKILYSDDDENEEDDEKLAVAATFGISAVFKNPRSPAKNVLSRNSSKDVPTGSSPGLLANQNSNNNNNNNPNSVGPSQQNADRDRLSVDISALTKQYRKLRQRQKQAQIILTSAINKQNPLESRSTGPIRNPPIAMNHLLLGKKPLVTSKPRRGPPPGAVPAPKVRHKKQDLKPNSDIRPTHYECPQPEVVSPSESRKNSANSSRKKKSSKDSCESALKEPPDDVFDIDYDLNQSQSSMKPNAKESANKSSSTELCNDQSEDATEDATDIEDIPKDKELAPVPEEALLLGQSETAVSQKTDVGQSASTESQAFIEGIWNDLDDKSRPNVKANDGKTFTEYDEDCSVLIEKKMPSHANSEKAIQIIKENSEILEKILRKKTENSSSPHSPHHILSSLRSSTCSSNYSLPKNSPHFSSFENESHRIQTPSSGIRSSRSEIKSFSISSEESANSRNSHRRLSAKTSSMDSTKPITFNPFPKPVMRKKNSELGKKLGLY